MKVHVRCIGCTLTYPDPNCLKLFHIHHRYRLEAANGLIDEEVLTDQAFIPEGDYELPDEDWTFDETKDYGEDKLNPEEKII